MEHACVIALYEKAECRTECRDFPGGPVVKNLPCNARDTGSIPGQGIKIPQARDQLSLCSATTKPKSCNYRSLRVLESTPQLERLHLLSPHATTREWVPHIEKILQ